MNGNRTARTASTKPVNINISFTINPKNILNHQSFAPQSQLKNKKISSVIQAQSLDRQLQQTKPKTPQLVNTERLDNNKEFERAEDKKEKKSRKRNSVDETYLQEYNKRSQCQKSVNLNKEGESLHVRKSSTKSKKQSDTSVKRNHNKTVSKISAVEGTSKYQNAGISNIFYDQRSKNLKSIINRLITNEPSKKSLPLQLPTQQQKTSRKKKMSRKKQMRQGKSQYLIRRQEKDESIQSINRKMLIEKLTSLRSINNSIFKSEEDEQFRPKQRRTIVINTDQSIDCIDEIHQIQKAAYRNKVNNKEILNERDKIRVKQTQNLIDNFVEILKNSNKDYEESILKRQDYEDEQNQYQLPIGQQFQQFRHQLNQNSRHSQHNHLPRTDLHQAQHQQLSKGHKRIEREAYLQHHQQRSKISQRSKVQQKEKDHLRQFCSSEMTKGQKMISQIQRVKLNQLKQHEVEKWSELLTFIKTSMNQGKTNHDEILTNIYQFLEQTKIDLQKEGRKVPEKSKDTLEEFTNKFSSNQLAQSPQPGMKAQKLNQSLRSISSMSYKDEEYEQQNEQLKMMNLQMIQSALKSRHQNLLEKRNKEITNLQQQKNLGKITQSQFVVQKQRIQKWTKRQTTEIMQARKNIWKGYNQAKGIIEKSLKSKHFQEESSKKKSMMKCLSENYLLKNYNYKKLLKDDDSEESDEQDQRLNKQTEDDEQSLGESQEHVSNRQHVPSEKSSKKQQIINSEEHDLEQSRNFSHQSSEQFDDHLQEQSPSKSSDKNVLPQEKENTITLAELKKLHEEEDMDVLKQKLLNIKQNHLHDDDSEKVDHSNDDISYEEVDNELRQSISDNEMRIISHELGKQGKLPSPYPQIEIDQRLKHILPEDKEDIFQFIFLDLSIELYQEPCHENKIMDCINKYVSYMKRQASKKKGVKTNLNVVKQYLKRFLGFILRAHKGILKTLDEPVGPTAIQMLRYMHENDEDPIQGEEAPSPLVIPTAVFDAFQKSFMPSIQFETYYEHDEERENKRVEFLKNIIHIHNKALFDAMNQYLDLLRPFGIWGKPFPWKNSSSFERIASQEEKEEKLKKSSQKVIEYCSYVCGLLVDKQQSLVGNARLSDQYIDQIKEDRLSRMLATELMQNQERWLFYDDEETEVLVEISNAVYTIMLREAAVQMSSFYNKSKQF